MAAKTAAQEEFDNLFAPPTSGRDKHPEDYENNGDDEEELDEDTTFRQHKIEDTMRMPVLGRNGKVTYKLPHQSFDSGRATGVKGVIADARHYQQMKKAGEWRGTLSSAEATNNGRVSGIFSARKQEVSQERQGGSYLNSESDDDEEFLEQWREARRKELLGVGSDIHNRRTSPSMRRFGNFDEVDALGYLDAIEKVGRETIVVVFVYDPECPVSQVIEDALRPLVPEYPAVHFVKVDYEAIEFENAGVPAILAYHKQGELLANLTYIIDSIPDDTLFDTDALKSVLIKNNIL